MKLTRNTGMFVLEYSYADTSVSEIKLVDYWLLNDGKHWCVICFAFLGISPVCCHEDSMVMALMGTIC